MRMMMRMMPWLRPNAWFQEEAGSEKVTVGELRNGFGKVGGYFDWPTKIPRDDP